MSITTYTQKQNIISLHCSVFVRNMASMNPRPLAAAPTKMQQRKERRMFSNSDDSAMMKQVQATHAPDGREIDVKPIIQIADEILIQVIARTVEGTHDDVRHSHSCMLVLNLLFFFYSCFASLHACHLLSDCLIRTRESHEVGGQVQLV